MPHGKHRSFGRQSRRAAAEIALQLDRSCQLLATPDRAARPRPVPMRTVSALLVAACLAATEGKFSIALHANTKLVFDKITYGVSRGYFDTEVPEFESLTLLCHPPAVPVAMVAGCLVGGKVECEAQSSMLAYTTMTHLSGAVRLTLEASSVAFDQGHIVVDQSVECDMVRNRINMGTRPAAPSNASAPRVNDLELVPATARLSASGTDQLMVAAAAKDFEDTVVASAASIGPFIHDTLIDVYSVDSSGSGCWPKSNLPFMLLDSVSTQEGPISCSPIKGDACGSMRCILPWTATRIDVTLRPSPTNAKSDDPLFVQALVVPIAQL